MLDALVKRCWKCKEIKPVSEFHKCSREKDGYQSACKLCKKILTKNKRRYPVTVSEKICSTCKEVKDASEFVRCAKDTTGLNSECKLCKHEKRKNKFKNDPIFRTKFSAYVNQYQKQRRATDPEWRERRIQCSHKQHIKRCRVKCGGDFTYTDWLDLLDKYNGCCAYCGKKCKSLTRDHVIPLKLGGLHTKENIVPACTHCNCTKSGRTPEQAGMTLHIIGK